MTILLALYLVLSLAILMIAWAMERAAILQRINGANGLTLVAAVVLSFAASLPVALIGGYLAGWTLLPVLLAASGLWHWGMLRLLAAWLQRIATRVARA